LKKSRFSEQQIVGVLKEAEAGAKTSDLCRKHGISSATFYTWKSKFGGMEVSDVAKMRGLEDEVPMIKLLMTTTAMVLAMLAPVFADGEKAVDCPTFIGNLNTPGAFIPLPRWSSDLPKFQVVERLVLLSECAYAQKDYANEIRYFNELQTERPQWGQDIYSRAVEGFDGALDTDRNGRVTAAEVYRHVALAYEAMHDDFGARVNIRIANDVNRSNPSDDAQIVADYQRIDAAQIKDLAQEQQQTEKTQKAARLAAIDLKRQKDIAAFHAWVASLPAGYRATANENGRPCHVSTMDSSLGHIEIWYYGCPDGLTIGPITFTFRNGALVSRQSD